jgi:hypothetical protein
LLLTDYLEFRWYVDGERRLSARLADWNGKRLTPHHESCADFETLVSHFLDADIPIIGQAKELARRMAAITRLIKDTVVKAMEEERKKAATRNQSVTAFTLHAQLAAFREIVIPDLSEADFADMHAQTIAYGMFAARMNRERDEQFTWQSARGMLPRNNPFLAKTFARIWAELDDTVTWAIEDLAYLLNRSDMDAILSQFRGPTRRGDPIVHFYETFLSEYDPETREGRGVYYTPAPVVSYMVRSVDEILRDEFGLDDGLSDTSLLDDGSTHRVQILDPACGTGTFLYAVIDHIFRNAYSDNQGLWPSYARKHLIPRLHGLELLMAPYAIAHMKLALLLEDRHAALPKDNRFGVYLTNALEEPLIPEHPPLFAQWLTDEAEAANSVKRTIPIMVVIGNPPYAEQSMNPSQRPIRIAKTSPYETYDGRVPVTRRAARDMVVEQRTSIGHLLRGWDVHSGSRTFSYFHVGHTGIGEANPKALHNDFVKFFRFAQWRVDQTGAGIVAFITDNVFLEGPVFRAMRKAFLDDFDSIYILDLHGSTLEPLPVEHQPDENVFGIRLGVCITILVKNALRKRAIANVFYSSVSGPLQRNGSGKFEWLESNSTRTTAWHSVDASVSPFVFKPRSQKVPEWKEWTSLADIFVKSSTGFKTHRDHFAVSFDAQTMQARVRDFVGGEPDDVLRARFDLKDNRDWNLPGARALARRAGTSSHIVRCLYRPFDQRFALLSKVGMDLPRLDVFDPALAGDNLYLGVGRQGKAVNDPLWNLVLISDLPIDTNAFRRGGVTVFPLRIVEGEMFGSAAAIANLRKGVPDRSPIESVYFIYAILHSNEYRRRYADYLRTEFPRIPLHVKTDLAVKLIELGRRLTALHLGRVTPSSRPTFPVPGGCEVVKIRYDNAEPSGRVWINRTQYFEGVGEAAWAFRVGGYEVLESWLKARRGQGLDHDALQHFRTMAGSVAETIQLQLEIDRVIEAHGGWPLEASLAAAAELTPA